jgi:hypothetical protein
VAFVRPDVSRYLYRREFWLIRTFFEVEMWRLMGPYIVDTIDSLTELAARHEILHEGDGMVVVDLEQGGGGDEPRPEGLSRDGYVRSLAEREGLEQAYHLRSRLDLVFADGFSEIFCAVTRKEMEALGQGFDCRKIGAAPTRWMGPIGHLRLRGRGAMRLAIDGRVATREIGTRPEVALLVDGKTLATTRVDEEGMYAIEVSFADMRAQGWHNAYLVISSVGEPWREPSQLALARVDRVVWEPALR